MASIWRTIMNFLFFLWSYVASIHLGVIAMESPYSAVQSYPVTFFAEPQSQTLAVGQQLNLICHANVTALPGVDYYTMPMVDWMFNGETLGDGAEWEINTNTDTGYSSLQVRSVDLNQAGDYECLVNDSEGHFITVSQTAVLQVVENELEELVVKVGEPVQLECGPLIPLKADTIWRYNDQDVNTLDDSIMIADGGHTLLLVQASSGNSGRWWCVGAVPGNDDVMGTMYRITVTQDTYSGPPLILFNTSQSNPQEGMPFILQCLRAPDTNAAIKWLRGEQELLPSNGVEISESSELIFDTFSSFHTGNYTCVLENEGEMVTQAMVDLQFSVIPKFILKPASQMYIAGDAAELQLTCMPTGSPPPNIRWIKDGVSLNTTLYDPQAGILRATPANVTNGRLHGVYQCFAENSAGVSVTMTRVLVEGVTNPPTDLVCEPITAPSFLPYIQLSWKAPVPNGGYQQSYNILISLTGIRIQSSLTDFANFTYTSAKNDDVYEMIVSFKDSREHITCIVDSTDRFTKVPTAFDVTCSLGSVHLSWRLPVEQPSNFPVTNFHVIVNCLHGNDSQFYDETFANVEVFDEEVLTGLPSGAVCLITGSYMVYTFTTRSQTSLAFPQANCFLGGTSAREEATPSDIRLNITCESSIVWLSWDVPNSICSNVEQLNISGVCLNETQREEYDVTVSATEIARNIITFPSVSSGAICSFTGFFVSDSNTVEVVAPVQCIMNEYTPVGYRIIDGNFTMTSKNCPVENFNGPSESMETITIVPEGDITVFILVALVMLISIVLLCLLAWVLVAVCIVCYKRRRRQNCERIEMEDLAYQTTTEWSIYFDDADTASIKTNLDHIFAGNATFEEKTSRPITPVVNVKVMERCELRIKRIVIPGTKKEDTEEDCSALASDVQPVNDLPLDSIEHWGVPVTKRLGEDSGCFLVTDKDGLAQEVSKREIPVDKTGSSGFWSESSAAETDMHNYHESIMQDLCEMEEGEAKHRSSASEEIKTSKCDSYPCSADEALITRSETGKKASRDFIRSSTVEHTLPLHKATIGIDAIPSVANDSVPTLASSSCPWDVVSRQKGILEMMYPVDDPGFVDEPETLTCPQEITGQKGVQTMDAKEVPASKFRDAEKRTECSKTLKSSVEVITKSPTKNAYINDPQDVHCCTMEVPKGLGNFFYTDGKGYVQFVAKSPETSLPALKN